MLELLTFPFMVLVILALYVFSAVNLIPEYERAVVFRLGRLLPEAKGPGVVFAFWPLDRLRRVSLRTVTLDVPSRVTT